jgi:hypothetical protein
LNGQVCVIIGELRGLSKVVVDVSDLTPDLDESPSLGALIGCVWTAYEGKCSIRFEENWSLRAGDNTWDASTMQSLGHALVAALEAAP